MFQSEIDIMLTNLSSLIYSTRVFEKSLSEEWKKGHDYIVSVESLFTSNVFFPFFFFEIL